MPYDQTPTDPSDDLHSTCVSAPRPTHCAVGYTKLLLSVINK